MKESGYENNKYKEATKKIQIINKINILTKAIKNMTKQTNLLALSIATEVAKNGSKFTVIEDEIRTLAIQSEKNTKQIEDVLRQVFISMGEFQDASEEPLQLINEQISEMLKQIGEIAYQYQEETKAVENAIQTILQNNEFIQTQTINIVNATNEIAMKEVENEIGVGGITTRPTQILEKIDDVSNMSGNTNIEADNIR